MDICSDTNSDFAHHVFIADCPFGVDLKLTSTIYHQLIIFVELVIRQQKSKGDQDTSTNASTICAKGFLESFLRYLSGK